MLVQNGSRTISSATPAIRPGRTSTSATGYPSSRHPAVTTTAVRNVVQNTFRNTVSPASAAIIPSVQVGSATLRSSIASTGSA